MAGPLKLVFKNQFGEQTTATLLNGPGQASPVVLGGEGAPAIAAPVNTLYVRTNASSVDAWIYRNTDGATTWVALESGAPAEIIATPITGFSAGAGTVAGTDSILVAFNKIAGNTQNRAVTANLLTGLAAGADTTILATDTVLEALAKLQAQIDALP